MEVFMLPLFVLAVGLGITWRLTSEARARFSRRRRLQRYRETTIEQASEGRVWLAGCISPGQDLLTSPLSGKEVVAWRLVVAQRWPNIAGLEAFRSLLDEQQAVDFRLQDDTGQAWVRARDARLLSGPELFRSRQGDNVRPPEELLAFLRERGVTVQKDIMNEVRVRFLELGFAPGDEVHVAGLVSDEVDPDSSSSGYREAPLRTALTGTAREPVILSSLSPGQAWMHQGIRKRLMLKASRLRSRI